MQQIPVRLVAASSHHLLALGLHAAGLALLGGTQHSPIRLSSRCGAGTSLATSCWPRQELAASAPVIVQGSPIVRGLDAYAASACRMLVHGPVLSHTLSVSTKVIGSEVDRCGLSASVTF